MRIVPIGLALCAGLGLPLAVRAQDTTRAPADSTPAKTAAAPALDFSGVLFLNYQSGGTRAERAAGPQNRFELDRAYLTFRAPAGERTSIRVTADVFQQRDGARDDFYSGWAFRAKYAYVQYDLLRARGGTPGVDVRLGMIQTTIIEHEERFWPRGLGTTAIDGNGFFSSADVGLAATVALPGKWGEIYATLLNGSGYQSRETDRFKDVGARFTITPLAQRGGLLGTLAVTPWVYKGWRASDFVLGPGSVEPVFEGRRKDRWGIHLGVRDPRITAGTQLAWRTDELESVADTTSTIAPDVRTRTGSLLSAYTVIKPLAILAGSARSPLNVVLRYDRVREDRDADPFTEFVVGGLGLDLNRRTSLWVDYQNQDPQRGSTATDRKTLFVHAIVNF